MNRKALTLTALITAAVLVFSCVGQQLVERVETSADTGTVILIDAGHGGFDGGTVASDGTVEKHINLAMADDLSAMLRLLGYRVEMTRETDAALCEDSGLTIREKKRADMRERLTMYDNASAVISIHQNHFPDSSCKGVQLLYSPNNSGSQVLGSYIREAVLEKLQPDNNRELKAGTGDVWLLHNTTVPAVLVECGFLSNPTEREQLKTTAYRQRLALAIAEGLIKFQP